MTTPTTSPLAKLIHIAKIVNNEGKTRYLFLRKLGSYRFVWFEEIVESNERETEVVAPSVEEALLLGHRRWKENYFRTVICGFRYTLPERDEHGINALFHQMVSSSSTINGIYYDEELGNNCFVQNASREAYDLWQRLKREKRL